LKICCFLAVFQLLEVEILAAGVNINFSEGKWDKSVWKYLKVCPYKVQSAGFKLATGVFKQEKDYISAEYSKKQIFSTTDNSLMVIDGISPTGEIVVEFGMDGKHTAPGLCLFPTYGKDMVLESAIVIHTASYVMAVWQIKQDKTKRLTRYKLLGRTVKWFNPSQNHTLRCRLEKNSIVVAVDNADPVGYRLQPWLPDSSAPETEGIIKPNGKIGLWACHGKCKFYSLKVLDRPTLPLLGKPHVKN
jgi:hypothetical protein